MNEICLHCHLLYFSSIILSFGQCESCLWGKFRYTVNVPIIKLHDFFYPIVHHHQFVVNKYILEWNRSLGSPYFLLVSWKKSFDDTTHCRRVIQERTRLRTIPSSLLIYRISHLLQCRINERMSCEESAIFKDGGS